MRCDVVGISFPSLSLLMGARTSNRKREDECLSFNRLHSSVKSPDFHVLKKRKFSIMPSGRPVVSSNSTVARLSRYPEETPQLRRQVHGPCRTPKFGISNSFSQNYEIAKNYAFGSLRHFRETEPTTKDVIELDSDRQTERGSSGDSKNEVIEYDKREGRLISLGQRLLEVDAVKEFDAKKMDVYQPSWSNVVVDLTNDNLKVENAERSISSDLRVLEVDAVEEFDAKRMDVYQPSWSNVVVDLTNDDLNVENAERSISSDQRLLEVDALQEFDAKKMDVYQPLWSTGVGDVTNDNSKVEDAEKKLGALSISAYKKLLQRAENRRPRIESLDFEIQLNERRRSVRPLQTPKKPVDKIPEELFTPLTEEEEAEVGLAFSTNRRRRVLVTHENSNIEIRGETLQCLRPSAWLNDEVINLYLELLKERERREPEKHLKCHFFNSFFYKKLVNAKSDYDYKSVRRWTSQRKLKYELIDCDKIFVPIHRDIHWCLAVINNKEKKFQYLDSLKGRDSHVLKTLARYYVDEVKDKSGKDIDISSWTQEFVVDLPAQKNGYDCGMFMIKYADFYSRGFDLCFKQEHMPYFRLRTAKEILKLRAN